MLRLRLLREKDPDLFQKTCQVLGKAVIACGLNPTKLSERCLFALYGIVDNIACGDINLEQLQRFVSSLTIERKGLPEALASVTGRTSPCGLDLMNDFRGGLEPESQHRGMIAY